MSKNGHCSIGEAEAWGVLQELQLAYSLGIQSSLLNVIQILRLIFCEVILNWEATIETSSKGAFMRLVCSKISSSLTSTGSRTGLLMCWLKNLSTSIVIWLCWRKPRMG